MTVLNERREQVMEVTRRYGRLDATIYRREIRWWSEGTRERDMRILVAAGLLRKHGFKKGCFYTPVEVA